MNGAFHSNRRLWLSLIIFGLVSTRVSSPHKSKLTRKHESDIGVEEVTGGKGPGLARAGCIPSTCEEPPRLVQEMGSIPVVVCYILVGCHRGSVREGMSGRSRKQVGVAEVERERERRKPPTSFTQDLKPHTHGLGEEVQTGLETGWSFEC